MTDLLPTFDRRPFPLLQAMAIVVFLAVLAVTGWSFYKAYRLENSLHSIQATLQTTEQQLTQLKAKNLDSLIVAQTTETQVLESIVWSKVVQELLKLTPMEVFYRSYSASNDGRMSVSVVTDSYPSAAHLIAILNDSEAFQDAFVASLSRAVSDSNQPVVTFGVTFSVDPSNL